MRQQELNRSEQESTDYRQIYRFKPSYLRWLSVYTIELILLIIAAEVITASFLPLPPSRTVSALFFSFLLMALCAYFITRVSEIVIDPLSLSFCNRIIRINWQDIITVKFGYFLWIRCILIESKGKRKRKRENNIITPFYNLPPILDRVREYAGADHPLTIALEKELLLPRQKPFKIIWRIIAGFALILTVWLIGGNLYADYRERPLEQAIASYIRQHPKTPPNQSAIELQALMAKLGINTAEFGDGSKTKVKPEQSALDEYEASNPVVNEYINKQLDKPEGTIEKVPAKLHDYLTKHRSTISTIQELLVTKDLPFWGQDAHWLERNHPEFKSRYFSSIGLSGYHNMLKMSRLLITDLIDRQGGVNKDKLKSLTAMQNISYSGMRGASFIEQFFTIIGERDVNKLFRHTDLTPTGWQGDKANPDREQMMKSSIEYELATIARATVQYPELLGQITEQFVPFKFLLRYHNLVRPYLRVVAAIEYQQDRSRLDRWTKLNICRADGEKPNKKFDFPIQYLKVKASNLDRELTTSVREIKSQLKAGVTADKIAKEFKLTSSTCAGENWTAKAKDGEVTISLSQPPNLEQLKIGDKKDIDRFTYRIEPAKA